MRVIDSVCKIRTLTICGLASLICACGPSEPLRKLSEDAKKGTVLLTCEDGWSRCYRDADKICGARGYTEVERHQSERVTATGRLDQSRHDDGELRADTRFDVQNQTLAIRCK